MENIDGTVASVDEYFAKNINVCRDFINKIIRVSSEIVISTLVYVQQSISKCFIAEIDL